MHILTYIYVHIYYIAYIHMYMLVYIYTYIHTYVLTCIYASVHIHIQTYIHAYMYILAYILVFTCKDICVYAGIQTTKNHKISYELYNQYSISVVMFLKSFSFSSFVCYRNSNYEHIFIRISYGLWGILKGLSPMNMPTYIHCIH